MASHVKTTVEIPDPLLEEARKLASREGATLRALVAEGLQKVVADRKRGPAFRLKKASFKGKGLRSKLRDKPWERIRDLAYGGRGS
jgi:hypothetical protein